MEYTSITERIVLKENEVVGFYLYGQRMSAAYGVGSKISPVNGIDMRLYKGVKTEKDIPLMV
jgi:hypothetical protein